MARAAQPAVYGIPNRDTTAWPALGELLFGTVVANDGGLNVYTFPTSSQAGNAFKTVTRTDDYSVTSTTFIDLDSTNLSHTITVGARRRVLVCVACDHNMMAANEYGYLDLTIDGVRAGTTSNGLARRGPEPSSGRGKITYVFLTQPLTGTHTFRVQARVSTNTGRFGLMYWGGGSITFTVAERG